MIKNITTVSLLLLLSLPLHAQKIDTIPSRINLGLNFVTIYTGIPEPQAEYFFGRNIGAFAATGYTARYRPRPVTGRHVRDEVSDVQGAYWKLGIKGRIIAKKNTVPWVQLLYIGSQYNESGVKYIYDNNTGTSQGTIVRNKGVAHGFAVAHGLDFGIGKHIALRFGFQVGYCKRNDYIEVSKTYQPGFGSYGVIIREQVMVGVMYRMGDVSKKVQN